MSPWHIGKNILLPLLSLAKFTSDAHNLTAILSVMRKNNVTLLLYQPYRGEIQQTSKGFTATLMLLKVNVNSDKRCFLWKVLTNKRNGNL